MTWLNLKEMDQGRLKRHLLFWTGWIVGFTFIKSFGQAYAAYLGWFVYYLVTLPIFVAHTYLITYVLIPRLLKERRFLSFTVFFLLLFYLFSVLELLLSHEVVFKWFPSFTAIDSNYLQMGNVIRNGVGNFYIILVFLAGRSVRRWYLADLKQKELQQEELRQQMENAMTRFQPMMLLYAIDLIDKLVQQSSEEVTEAIAKTSELLNEVMVYHEEKNPLFSREIELVKKLVALNTLLREKKPDVEFFISGDPGRIKLPPMILFSVVDQLFRKIYENDLVPELYIEASGFSDMVTVQVMFSESKPKNELVRECMQTIEQLDVIQQKCYLEMELSGFGCTLIIRNITEQQVKTVHPYTGGVHNA